jgi:hypothetical protein
MTTDGDLVDPPDRTPAPTDAAHRLAVALGTAPAGEDDDHAAATAGPV